MHVTSTSSSSSDNSDVTPRPLEKTSSAINRDSASDDTQHERFETPTRLSVSLTTNMVSTLRISAPTKLADVNRSVTHPIRLLHESLMSELFQEQLREPSPARQSVGSTSSSNNNRYSHARYTTDLSYGATWRQRSAGSGTTRNSLNSSDGGRTSISLLPTPRPTVILYEDSSLPPQDARVSVGRPSSSTSPLARVSATAFELTLDPSPRPSTVITTRTRPPSVAMTAASLTVVAAASAVATLDGFDTAQQRDCQICFDTMDTLQAHVCVVCSSAFCSTCMQWYVEFKIQDGDVSRKKLVCPAPQCSRALPEELIEAFATPAAFAKYQNFVATQRAGVRFCPQAGCCAMLDEPLFSTHRRVECQACERESCMRCGGAYHATRLCRRTDKRFSKWKRHHNVRACPTCKVDIEKQGGCSHMKCGSCDQEFCWSCLRNWDAHDETLCVPLAFYHSRSRKYGWTTPMRFVTKSVVLGVASVAAVAGAGVAVVVLPPLIAYHLARDSYRRKKHRQRLSGLQAPDVAPPA